MLFLNLLQCINLYQALLGHFRQTRCWFTGMHEARANHQSRYRKLNDKDDHWQPAPTAYQPCLDAVKGDSKASRFGGGNRSDIASGKAGPGPGSYNAGKFRPTESISYSIGDSKRTKTKNLGNPGPG